MEQEKLLTEYSDNIYSEQNQGEGVSSGEEADSGGGDAQDNGNGSKKSIITAIIIIAAIGGFIYASNLGDNNVADNKNSKNEAGEEIFGEDESADKQEQEKNRQKDSAEMAILGDEGQTFRVYFSKKGEEDCGKVYPLERQAKEGEEMISTALFHLFAGPVKKEKEEGYDSFFSDKTLYILKWVKITDGSAYVNLKDIRDIIPNASSSCGNEAFEAQIRKTIEQFVDIKKLVIAIEGDPQTYYEWNQTGCQDNLCDKEPFEEGLSF